MFETQSILLHPLLITYRKELFMAEICFPYGKEKLSVNIPDYRLNGILVSELHNYNAKKSGIELICDR